MTGFGGFGGSRGESHDIRPPPANIAAASQADRLKDMTNTPGARLWRDGEHALFQPPGTSPRKLGNATCLESVRTRRRSRSALSSVTNRRPDMPTTVQPLDPALLRAWPLAGGRCATGEPRE